MTPAVAPAALTDESGEFRLTALPGGDYYIQAVPPHGNARSKAWTSLPTYLPRATHPADAQVLTVAPGLPVEPITIRIVGVPAYQVSGTVSDDRGQPIADVMLELVEDEASTPRSVNALEPRRSRTETSGHFTIEEVTDGDYILIVVAPVVIAIDVQAYQPENSGSGGGPVMVACGGGGSRLRRFVVHTRTVGGITTQFTFADATEVSLAVRQASVSGLRVIVPANQ